MKDRFWYHIRREKPSDDNGMDPFRLPIVGYCDPVEIERVIDVLDHDELPKQNKTVVPRFHPDNGRRIPFKAACNIQQASSPVALDTSIIIYEASKE